MRRSNEHQLSEVLSEFARTMVTDFPIQAILDELVARIVEILPIDAAGVTLISPKVGPRYISASDDAALRYEKLQSELDEGPCVLAYQSGEAVSVPDLNDEQRFPVFGPRALAAGLKAVFTFPLRRGDEQLGALDLYRQTPGPFPADSMSAAQTLADVAAAYLLNAQAREDLQGVSDRARHAAMHDPLTGLPNRVLLLDRLTHASLRGRRTGKGSAVLYVDLDRFKEVNDTYGHRVGDALLVAVARRLEHLLRPHDTLARLSGDEFVVLCEDLTDSAEAEGIGARLSRAMNRPIVLSGMEIPVGASIGIAYSGGSDHDPEQLIHDADLAMYSAKRNGGRQHQVFIHRQTEGHRAGLDLDLRGALDRGEFHLEYQPIVASADGQVTGLEALIRWQHPARGLIPPATLIPLAERSGLITEIGEWVLSQAWTDARRWQQRHNGRLSIGVNVSAHQLMAAEFTDTVATVLRTAGSDPNWLTLEVTESVFVRDSDRALLVLNDLKSLGVTLALDDFGTGYSSLSYLRRFPVDVVKIDQTFIADLGLDSTGEIIVGAVIRLAHDLKMSVVAEGVESAHQHREVRALDCDFCQGFYFSRPMIASKIDLLIGNSGDAVDARLPDPRKSSDTVAAQVTGH